MKKDDITQKEKNIYLFFKNLYFNPSFNDAALLIYNKWGLPLNEETAKDCLIKFEKEKGKKAVYEFLIDLNKLAKDFNLGKQWLDFLGSYFLKGNEFLLNAMPIPENSFYISDTKTSKNEKAIKLEIGPYTTYREIKKFWPKIEKLQKIIWNNVKKDKISKKSIDKMILSLNVDLEKYRVSKLIEFKDPKLNRYEQIQEPLKDYEEDKLLKIYKPQKYSTIANILLDEEDDLNASFKKEKAMINRIKQIKHREKK